MEIFRAVVSAVVALGSAGLIFGALLALAGRRLAVKENPRIGRLLDALPGANCGACGKSGCRRMAEELDAGRASPGDCPVNTPENDARLSELLGLPVREKSPLCAQVLCSGTRELALFRFEYQGIRDCRAAARFGGGDKQCPYGCLGYGTCAEVCPTSAILIINGVATVDKRRCIDCGRCAEVCPKQVIRMLPAGLSYWVGCSSKDPGSKVRPVCQVGCIACRRCEQVCPAGAIVVSGGIAIIDYEKCTGCGRCAEICPRKVIWSATAQQKKPTLQRQDIDSES